MIPELVGPIVTNFHGPLWYSEPMLTYCQLNTKEQNSVKFESNHKILIQQIIFQSASCKTAATFFSSPCVTINDIIQVTSVIYNEILEIHIVYLGHG